MTSWRVVCKGGQSTGGRCDRMEANGQSIDKGLSTSTHTLRKDSEQQGQCRTTGNTLGSELCSPLHTATLAKVKTAPQTTLCGSHNDLPGPTKQLSKFISTSHHTLSLGLTVTATHRTLHKSRTGCRTTRDQNVLNMNFHGNWTHQIRC